MNQDQELKPGLEVFSSDGVDLGPIKRVWWPDGRVEPAEDHPDAGTFTIDPLRKTNPESGYFQVDRTLSPDWYVPFSAVEAVGGNQVVLNATHQEARSQPWQERPV